MDEERHAPTSGVDDSDRPPTYWQRQSLKKLTKYARKHPDEPLTPDDWEAYWRFGTQPSIRAFKRVMRALPSTPRCGYCGAPFAGIGAHIVRPLGYRPSRKNPNLCASCVELAPPGGMTAEVGVLFADLRGFTSRSEGITPAEATAVLRRFYAHAEKVLFPEALIDKLIGDEVMALYLPRLVVHGVTDVDDEVRRQVATVMLDHAHELLERVGYGAHTTPEIEVGIGLDFGEAFIGNIGNAAVHDFTAVGDVVNTASRLQAQAAGGEVVVSARLAAFLESPPGQLEQLEIKGKQDPVPAYRARWFAQPS
jgi:adenylate cyclase